MDQDKPQPLPSSYRDPSGFVFTHQNTLYRQVNKAFQADFETFVSSGLYNTLVAEKKLIPHEVLRQNLTGDAQWYTTLKPLQLRFVSYPYEWCFSMLKDAALLTLDLALKALDFGMVLKDASPYNVQYHEGKMIFIDTLSFKRYVEGEPWIAYRQFCENFLAPLALMHYSGLPLQQLFVAYPDGIPLAVTKKLLPFKSRWNPLLYLHIHLHAAVTTKPAADENKGFLSKAKLQNLLKGLQSLVSSFRFENFENVWGRYYEEAETRTGYLEEKKAIVSGWLSHIKDVSSVIDVGGNRGEFSRLALAPGRFVVCADGEHYAVDQLYKQVKDEALASLIPLVVDFSHPSPAIGVNNEERPSFLQRASSDLVMALALVHHLAIGKNIPFHLQAKMFAQLGRYLIIEFVEKDDEKAKLLLARKKDVYDWYTKAAFLRAFAASFSLVSEQKLSSISCRTLYVMKRL